MVAKDGRIDARDWSLLGVLSVLWGGSFFFNGLALKELPPLTLVLLRVALGALFLLPLVRAYRIEFPKGIAGWKPFFAVAFFNNLLPFSLIVMGQTFIASGLASVLIGVIILRGGVGLDAAGQGVGVLLCLAAAASYGVAALLARRQLADSPPLATATFQLLASSAMMSVVAGIVERPWTLPMPGASTWFAVIGLAALSTALAYIVFFHILRRSGATNVMLVTLLIPVTAILLGYLMLGESISLREISGALVIGSALLLIDGRVLEFSGISRRIR